MTNEQLIYLTAAVYWLLVVFWSAIVVFYLRQYWRLRKFSPLLQVLLIVVIIDGTRTLIESLYFGVWYTARTGLLPERLYDILAEPQFLIQPKMLTLLSALVIILVILRKWLPDFEREMIRRQETDRLHREVTAAHEELKGLHKLQDDLTHMIAHDMQNPLAAAIGSLKTLSLPEPRLSQEQQAELIEMALGSAQTLQARVSDLLDLGRLETGQTQLLRAPVRPVELAQAARDQVAYQASQSDLRIGLDFPEDLPLVEVDQGVIGRVLVNLLDNATKFSPPGEEILVSARLEPEGGLVRFSVSDRGEGVPKELQERIFDKFFFVNGEAGQMRSSWGLGLAFCRFAVEAHGGRIWVESAEETGTTFHFTVPAVPSSAA